MFVVLRSDIQLKKGYCAREEKCTPEKAPWPPHSPVSESFWLLFVVHHPRPDETVRMIRQRHMGATKAPWPPQMKQRSIASASTRDRTSRSSGQGGRGRMGGGHPHGPPWVCPESRMPKGRCQFHLHKAIFVGEFLYTFFTVRSKKGPPPPTPRGKLYGIFPIKAFAPRVINPSSPSPSDMPWKCFAVVWKRMRLYCDVRVSHSFSVWIVGESGAHPLKSIGMRGANGRGWGDIWKWDVGKWRVGKWHVDLQTQKHLYRKITELFSVWY